MGELKLGPNELERVREILRSHLPGVEVWAFGSRVHGANLKPFSDLDLALITKAPLDLGTIADLKEAFTESDLPFKVDLLDWSTLGERFKERIREDHRIVQEGGGEEG